MYIVVLPKNNQGNRTVHGQPKETFEEALDMAKSALLTGNQVQVSIFKEEATIEREMNVIVKRS